MTRPRSAFVPMGCSRTKVKAVARFAFREPGTWQLAEMRVAAVPASRAASRPQDLTGTFEVLPSYAGCPQCAAPGFVRCGACGELSCYRSDQAIFSCSWCPNSGPVAGTITSLSRLD
jgi:hypothetical protein